MASYIDLTGPDKEVTAEARDRLDGELHAAIGRRDVDAVRRCLDDGADMNRSMTHQIVTSKGTFRTYCSPIRTAAALGSVDVFRLLLDRGAAFDLTRGLIDAIIQFQTPHMALLLIEKGAKLTPTCYGDSSPCSVLMKAVRNPNVVVVAKTLLDRGAPVNWATRTGKTALCVACEHGNLDAVRLLISRGATVDRRSYDVVKSASYARAKAIKALFDAQLALRIRFHVVGPRGENPGSARREIFFCRSQISRAIVRRVISFVW